MENITLEQFLTVEEISQPRTPGEYIIWFEEKLEINRKFKEELREQMLLRKGKIVEYYYNELFPLWRLLQNKREAWKELTFVPFLGNQNFDVEVRTNRKDVPKYIEITNTDMDEKEYAINKILFKERQADITVSKTKEEVKNRIKEGINAKMKVTSRPDNTALLVYFNDYNHSAFYYADKASLLELSIFLESLESIWQKRYFALYVVGLSGKSFWES